MKCYVLKNERGEYFSPRSANCSQDFSPFSHLFRNLKSAKFNLNVYVNHNLHIEEVEVDVLSSKKI